MSWQKPCTALLRCVRRSFVEMRCKQELYSMNPSRNNVFCRHMHMRFHSHSTNSSVPYSYTHISPLTSIPTSLSSTIFRRSFAWWPFGKSSATSPSSSTTTTPNSSTSSTPMKPSSPTIDPNFQFPYVQDQFEEERVYRSPRELPQPTPEQLAQMDYIDPEIYKELKKFYIENTGVPRPEPFQRPNPVAPEEHTSPKMGKLTSLQLSRFLTLHCVNSGYYTTEVCAEKFKIDPKDANKIVAYIQPLVIWQERRNMDETEDALHAVSSANVRFIPYQSQKNAVVFGEYLTEHLKRR